MAYMSRKERFKDEYSPLSLSQKKELKTELKKSVTNIDITLKTNPDKAKRQKLISVREVISDRLSVLKKMIYFESKATDGKPTGESYG